MLTIRFNRTGKKNKAQFRIVVQEHTVAPGGRHVEVVGSYDPHSKNGVFQSERIKYWIEKGAQVSDSVYNLLITKEVITGKKRAKNIGSKNKGKAEAEGEVPAAAPAAEQVAENKPEADQPKETPVAEPVVAKKE